MASIISAGTTSGTSLNLSGDTSGILQLATNGSTTAVTINTSQNVGIGTSTITSGAGWTPTLVLSATSAALIVKGVSGQEGNFGVSGGLYIDSLGHSTGTNNNIIFRNTASNSSYSATERMRIDSAGNVGIGTSSPAVKLDVSGRIATNDSAVVGTSIYIWSQNRMSLGASYGIESQQNSPLFMLTQGVSQPIVFGTNGVEAMRVSSGQQVGIGKSPAVTLDVNGAINYDPNVTTNGLSVVYRATFNDSSARDLGAAFNNTFGVITIKGTSGAVNIPFFSNGGNGIAYACTTLDPDAGTWTYGAGPTITFTISGTGGSTFTLAFSGGSGIPNLQRTSGSGSFTVVIQHYTT